MTSIRFLAGLVGVAGMALPALAQSTTPQQLQHASTSFDLVVDAPFAKAAPLFKPESERLWAGEHWDPVVLYPQPATDAEGMVFTVQHGARKAVWVNTLMDAAARHFQYVYVIPEIMVTVIDVRFNVIAADATGVNVVYTRTALTPEGNQHVNAMSEGDKTAGKEWEQAIGAYLAQVKAAGKQ
jgi:hypothetical protein